MNSKPLLGIFKVEKHDLDDVDAWFCDYNRPMTDLQKQAVSSISQAGKVLVLTMLRNIPKCADRSAAIRKVRESVSTAIEGVTLGVDSYIRQEVF